MSPNTASPRGLFALALLEMRGIGATAARRILQRLGGEVAKPDFDIHSSEILRTIFSEPKIAELADAFVKAESLLAELAATDTTVVVAGDPDYPAQLNLLGDDAPLTIMLRGNKGLLDVPGIGFCGSRKASERGIEASTDLAHQLGERKMNAVSGYAAGVDTAVHLGALQKGGTTTIVLPLGVNHFRIKKELKPMWDWDRVLVLSQFPAGLPWQARNAMLRNATICALSDAIVVVEAGSEGGTLEAGKTAIQLGLPVFAVHYDGDADLAPGNRLLMGLGAHPLGRSRISGRANVNRVIEASQRQRGHLAFL